MNRRHFLGLVGAGVAGLAGCGSSSDEEPPTLNDGGDGTPTLSNPVYPFDAGSAADFEFEESDDGTVLIRVPVENTREKAYTAEMSLTVTVDGESRTVTETVQLAGNESTMVPVEIDADWDDWTPNFRDVSFSRGTPTDESG
ncbi:MULTISPECIES: twin-arginine translocation signal domain-containing protein [Salinibaculum]|uniref:twin-arginine translocation signal domain-containing protein n=1 Tax=Salinibaculum TaxID=2732368 RepID=UPI0030CCDD9A